MKKLRVVQILPALESGGVERGTLEIARALVEKGHRAIVISSGGQLVKELESMGARHIYFPILKKSIFTFRHISRLRRVLLELKADVIHVRSRLPAWLIYFAWKKMPLQTRPRLISTVHGLYSVNHYSRVMTFAEKIIVVSKTARDYVLINYKNIDEKKIRVIYRGIDAKQFPRDYRPESIWLDSWKQQFPQLEGKKVLLLPGRISRLKGHETFIQLIKKLIDNGEAVHGLIVGGIAPGKQRYLKQIKSMIKSLDLSDALSFTGSRSDIKDIYAVSDLIFSLSNKPESFGRTVLEAVAMGRPVVAWNYGGVGEILSAMFPQGKITKNDMDGLYKTTIMQLQQPGQPLQGNPFKLQTMLDKTLQLYEEISRSNLK